MGFYRVSYKNERRNGRARTKKEISNEPLSTRGGQRAGCARVLIKSTASPYRERSLTKFYAQHKVTSTAARIGSA